MITQQAEGLDFTLQWYNPSTGNDKYPDSDNNPSGAYLFKPSRADPEKKTYSKFVRYETYEGTQTGVSAMVLYFSDEDTGEMYTSLVRMLPDSTTVEWEVQLHSIPVETIKRKGKEVVVNWSVSTFDNDYTFYTDSNGLEMQKRVLNQRPDFTLTTDEIASSNYYPINSAIAIRRKSDNTQLTVMNDRSQGGSVLSTGSVEIMQNRRLMFEDGRGVGENLNETNENGVGIQVNTRYFLQIFDRSTRKSEQRQVQLAVDEPLQYFMAPAETDEISQSDAQPSAKVPDFDGDLKIHLLPLAKNQILIRMENLSDLFDNEPV